MFSPKPKKLNLREIWKLYKTLKPTMPEKEEEFLLFELIEILKKLSTPEFVEILRLFYRKDFNEESSSGDSALLFVKGIKLNKLFSFVGVIEGFKHGSSE